MLAEDLLCYQDLRLCLLRELADPFRTWLTGANDALRRSRQSRQRFRRWQRRILGRACLVYSVTSSKESITFKARWYFRVGAESPLPAAAKHTCKYLFELACQNRPCE